MEHPYRGTLSAIKRDELSTHPTMCVNLKITILNERSQSKRVQKRFHLYKTIENIK